MVGNLFSHVEQRPLQLFVDATDQSRWNATGIDPCAQSLKQTRVLTREDRSGRYLQNCHLKGHSGTKLSYTTWCIRV